MMLCAPRDPAHPNWPSPVNVVMRALVRAVLIRSILAASLSLPLLAPLFAQDIAPPAEPKEKLRHVERELEKSNFEQRRLTYEIENLSAEAQQSRTALVDIAKKIRAAEDRIAEADTKLTDITTRENALRRSLQARERVTAEVLAAMQRIGRKPPPAVLVSPEDVLGAVRAAILLGAVLPDMRDEAMILIADLRTLVEIRKQAAALTQQLVQERNDISAERTRLTGLIEARQNQIGVSRSGLEAEKTRVAILSRDARSLRDLIGRSENEIVGATRASEIARRAPAPQRGSESASLGPDGKSGPDAKPGADATRLQPRTSFTENRGRMSLPVSGTVSKSFGQPDGLGGTERGITLLSSKDALVTAPADGWVHFAGPYRGYGHLIIINAGNGYHIVMAGLGRLDVEIGQFVLAGEPIGQLGVSTAILAGETVASPRPALYVEFRKEGSSIDPSPYWTPQSAEKARG